MTPPAGEDLRTARTKARLRRALLAECAKGPLEGVSVSALVRRAGVGRATFYLHYDDLRALAVDACAEVVREAVDALHAWQGPAGRQGGGAAGRDAAGRDTAGRDTAGWRGIAPPQLPPTALTVFFEAVADHAALYRALLRPGGSGPLGELLHRELRERSRADRERAGAPHPDLAASAVAAAFTGVLADWLHGLVGGEPAVIARRVWRLLLRISGV